MSLSFPLVDRVCRAASQAAPDAPSGSPDFQTISGGIIAFATWPPEMAVGDPNLVRERLGNKVTDLVFDRGCPNASALSPAHFRFHVERNAGPIIKGCLPERKRARPVARSGAGLRPAKSVFQPACFRPFYLSYSSSSLTTGSRCASLATRCVAPNIAPRAATTGANFIKPMGLTTSS